MATINVDIRAYDICSAMKKRLFGGETDSDAERVKACRDDGYRCDEYCAVSASEFPKRPDLTLENYKQLWTRMAGHDRNGNIISADDMLVEMIAINAELTGLAPFIHPSRADAEIDMDLIDALTAKLGAGNVSPNVTPQEIGLYFIKLLVTGQVGKAEADSYVQWIDDRAKQRKFDEVAADADSEDSSKRLSAAEALEGYVAQGAVGFLIDLAGDEEPAVALAALNSLKAIMVADAGALESRREKLAAALKLSKIDPKADIAKLIDDKIKQFEKKAAIVKKEEEKEAAEAEKQAELEAAEAEKQEQLEAAEAEKQAQLEAKKAEEEAFNALKKQARSYYNEDRIEAAVSLGESSADGAVAVLAELASDPFHEVGMQAFVQLTAIAQEEPKRVRPAIAQIATLLDLKSTPDVARAREAAALIGIVGVSAGDLRNRVIGALRFNSQNAKDEKLRGACLQALARMGITELPQARCGDGRCHGEVSRAEGTNN